MRGHRETMTITIKAGDKVRLIGRMGAMRRADVDQTKFDASVEDGTEGVYFGRHVNGNGEFDDWHVVQVDVDGEPMYVPVHASQFTAAMS